MEPNGTCRSLRGEMLGRRRRRIVPVGLLLALAAATTRGQLSPDRLRVSAPGGRAVVVGQLFELVVSLPPGSEAGTLTARPFEGGRLEVGSSREGTTQKAWLVASRPGRLTLPGFELQVGDQRLRSNVLVFDVRSVPLADRPSTFLGGVGAVPGMELRWEPERVHVGEAATLELVTQGAASAGMTTAPVLIPASGGPECRIQALPALSTLDPPARRDRWRVRPLQPGRLAIRPITISWYDLATGRFGLGRVSLPPLTVEPLPVGASALALDDGPRQTSTRSLLPSLLAAALITLIVAGLLGRWVVHGRRRLDPARHWRGTRAAWLRRNQGRTADAFARWLSDELGRFLRSLGRAGRGPMTPEEARRTWMEWVGDEALANRASCLVELCDGAIYDRPQNAPSTDHRQILDEAIALLDETIDRQVSRQGTSRPPDPTDPSACNPPQG